MKKMVLTVAMVAMLVAVVFIGQASSFPGANITVSPSSGGVGTMVRVTGSGWTSGVPVNVYMDSTDQAHLLATVTPQYVGIFTVNFIMSATTVGVHPITAIQDAKVASAQFTLCTTQPIDERTGEALTGIETDISAIKSELGDVTRMDTIDGTFYPVPNGGYQIVRSLQYGEFRHVSLSLHYSAFPPDVGGSRILSVWAIIGISKVEIAKWEMPPAGNSGYATLDFNTYCWGIEFTDSNNTQYSMVDYVATTTYASSP